MGERAKFNKRIADGRRVVRKQAVAVETARRLVRKLSAPKLAAKDSREILTERVFRTGFIVRRERIGMAGNPFVEMDSAYTPNGEYIGQPKDARYLVAKRGIRPQLRTATSNTCSIGYNAKERTWYGWSHRAIVGFRVGSVVTKGSCCTPGLPVGFRAKTLADAKRMAEVFAESVS